MNVTLPYSALDLSASFPLLQPSGPLYEADASGNMISHNASAIAEASTVSRPYLPFRRAENENRYVLGRTFLQEAYIIADYERQNFSVNAYQWNSTILSKQNIVTISSVRDETTSSDNGNSNAFPSGAIAGIAIAIVTLISILLAILFLLRRTKHKHKAVELSSDLPHVEETEDSSFAAIDYHDTKPELDVTRPVRYELHSNKYIFRPATADTNAVFEMPYNNIDKIDVPVSRHKPNHPVYEMEGTASSSHTYTNSTSPRSSPAISSKAAYFFRPETLLQPPSAPRHHPSPLSLNKPADRRSHERPRTSSQKRVANRDQDRHHASKEPSETERDVTIRATTPSHPTGRAPSASPNIPKIARKHPAHRHLASSPPPLPTSSSPPPLPTLRTTRRRAASPADVQLAHHIAAFTSRGLPPSLPVSGMPRRAMSPLSSVELGPSRALSPLNESGVSRSGGSSPAPTEGDGGTQGSAGSSPIVASRLPRGRVPVSLLPPPSPRRIECSEQDGQEMGKDGGGQGGGEDGGSRYLISRLEGRT
ncbi:hypothetical protein LTS18_005456 [Coniosporium uncinatum]|uniref:Uncharacterized protein n=1 Tax=Coniosporium uncinatum TaxID=93489 RepID=A0ACC3DRP8_9PEZI|nr:hypothetical protein LTS18_005456 [Coniosporium uncinatum]